MHSLCCRFTYTEICSLYLVQIGIHNGWTYVADPEIVQLTIDSTDSKGSTNTSFRRNSINRRSSQRIASTGLISWVPTSLLYFTFFVYPMNVVQCTVLIKSNSYESWF